MSRRDGDRFSSPGPALQGAPTAIVTVLYAILLRREMHFVSSQRWCFAPPRGRRYQGQADPENPHKSSRPSLLAIVLAAGEGVRMRSSRPKVLHAVAGRPMIAHALAATLEAGADAIAVVVGPDRDDVAEAARRVRRRSRSSCSANGAGPRMRSWRRGRRSRAASTTSSSPTPTFPCCAARRCRPCAPFSPGRRPGRPRLRARRPDWLRAPDRAGRPARGDPRAQGRDEAEREARLCNAGPVAFRGDQALAMLEAVTPATPRRNIISPTSWRSPAPAASPRRRSRPTRTRSWASTTASSSPRRGRDAGAAAPQGDGAGATLIAPETVFLRWDTEIGRDVLIEPNVVFGQGVTIDDGATIHAFSHLEGAQVAAGPRSAPRPAAPRGRRRGRGPGRQFRRDQERRDRGRRQGQPPELYRRRAGRRGRQYRRGHDHLQLRRLLEIQDRHRRGRVHRLQLVAGGAGDDRRRRLCRLGLGDHPRRRARRARRRPRPAGGRAGWAKAFRAKKKK